MAPTGSTTFGSLLKQLRKRAGMTQADLAAAVGYSIPFISNLELNQRLPDLQIVLQLFVPALGLQDEPHATASLLEQAALARGERLPASLTIHHTTQVAVHDELRQTQSVPTPMLLPAPPTELIGRTSELHQLCNRLLGHSGRLLTLIGPPGIGKTTLALAMAARLQLYYLDGAVFVPLAVISDPTLMAATILTTLGSSDLNPPQSKLIAFLRHKSLLLVLDNLEQISAAAPFIAELVAACPKLSILATSRERLHLRAEQRFQVPPLALAPALELFIQRAQAVAAHFLCTPQNRATLEAICHRLDCLPLAIELCAAQIDLLAPSQLLTQLHERRLDLLVDGAHDLPPRQRTLRTAIGASYSLLNESERLLFQALGVFMGGFALPEVTAVAADRLEPASVQSTLHGLIGKSLVRAEPLPNGEQRFLLLETIREFALEQARAHGEETLLRQRHYAAYLQLFRAAATHINGAEAATWFARIEPEQDNLRAALRWTLDSALYADTAWLLMGGSHFWFHHGHWSELGRWVLELLQHRHLLHDLLRLVILLNFYPIARALAEPPSPDYFAGEVIALLADCPYQLAHAAAWHFFATYAPDFAQAAAAWERALVFARAAGDAPGLGPEFGALADPVLVLGNVLWAYAHTLIEEGEFVRAIDLTLESRALFQTRGNRYELVDSLGNLGRLALLQGDLTQAFAHLEEAVNIATTFNYQEGLGQLQPLFAIVTLYRGNAQEARRLLSESLRLCTELKDKFLLARVTIYLVESALWTNEVDEARQWLAQSLGYQQPLRRMTLYDVAWLWVAARLATAQQQYQRAATLFGLADQIHSQIHHVIAGPMRALADDALATVRAALESAVFAEAFAVGRQMALAEAFATILAPVYVADAFPKA